MAKWFTDLQAQHRFGPTEALRKVPKREPFMDFRKPWEARLPPYQIGTTNRLFPLSYSENETDTVDGIT